MRVTVVINNETDIEVLEHIKKLRENGDNISRFFINSAKKALGDDKEELRAVVREIIEEEYNNTDTIALEPSNNTIDLSKKLKDVY